MRGALHAAGRSRLGRSRERPQVPKKNRPDSQRVCLTSFPRAAEAEQRGRRLHPPTEKRRSKGLSGRALTQGHMRDPACIAQARPQWTKAPT